MEKTGEVVMPKVSIVLPTYNGEKYIKESIDSIINQVYMDWELIIVNDCSNDNTLQIIHEYEERDKRIKVINNPKNRKLPKSLNIGFKNAVGEYLTWTSDDNIYLPNAIEKMVNYLEEHPADYMVCAGMNWIDADGNILQENHPQYSNKRMMSNDYVGACFLYRRKVIYDVGEYDPNMFFVEDYEYWLRILFKYKYIANINEILYLYRRHNDSLTATKKDEIHRQLLNLRKKYISSIIAMPETDNFILSELYYDFKFNNALDDDLDKMFRKFVPILKKDVGYIGNDVMVYGAGKFGQMAYEKMKENIYCFADRDEKKIGKKIGDKIIVSLAEMKQLSDSHQIVIAADIQNIYSFLLALDELEVEKCSVFIP